MDESRVTLMRALHRTKQKKGEPGASWLLRTTKNTGSRRTISIPEIAVAALGRHKEEIRQLMTAVGDEWIEGDFVFPSAKGTQLDVSNALHLFQKVSVAADLPKLRFYDLRHTHVSLLIAGGLHPKLIAERLGHASIKLTMGTYGHLFEGSDREASAAMDHLYSGKNAGEKVAHEKWCPLGS